MWDHSYKCVVFQHTVKRTVITHLHRTEETVTDCSFVARQRTQSYCCP